MENIIYYPGFEVKNEKWLKFAILYFDDLRPIIPDMFVKKSEYLSDKAIRIMEDTDLIHPYKPSFDEGCVAVAYACERFDNYLKRPNLYSRFFTVHNRSNIINKWTNPDNHLCKLYEGKFNRVFEDYCKEHKLSTPFENGIMISEDLAFVYMSFLADLIARNNDYEMFTDSSRYNTQLINSDINHMHDKSIDFQIAKKYIDFVIPAGLEQIPYKKIIELRNSKDFTAYRRSYAKEIKKFISSDSREDFISYNSKRIANDISRLLYLTVGTVTSTFLTYTSLTNLFNDNQNIALDLATAYSDLSSLKELYYIPSYIKETKMKLQAHRYLGKIKRISREKNF